MLLPLQLLLLLLGSMLCSLSLVAGAAGKIGETCDPITDNKGTAPTTSFEIKKGTMTLLATLTCSKWYASPRWEVDTCQVNDGETWSAQRLEREKRNTRTIDGVTIACNKDDAPGIGPIYNTLNDILKPCNPRKDKTEDITETPTPALSLTITLNCEKDPAFSYLQTVGTWRVAKCRINDRTKPFTRGNVETFDGITLKCRKFSVPTYGEWTPANKRDDKETD